MAKVYNLYVGIATALFLCKYGRAEWNTTKERANQTVSLCDQQGHGNNCTGNADAEQWNGHFSKCPKELLHYCVHGECRYIQAQKTPSCRCLHGYTGSRCEYVDLDWRKAEKQHIIISCVIAVLIFLIILIVFIFIYSRRGWRLWRWCRGRRREEPSNGTEKHSMIDTGAPHTVLKLDSMEPTHSNPV